MISLLLEMNRGQRIMYKTLSKTLKLSLLPLDSFTKYVYKLTYTHTYLSIAAYYCCIDNPTLLIALHHSLKCIYSASLFILLKAEIFLMHAIFILCFKYRVHLFFLFYLHPFMFVYKTFRLSCFK